MNDERARTSARGLVVVAVAALVTACSSATPTATPGIDQLGEFIRRQSGPEVDAVVGYRFAAANLGSEWLILELAVSSPEGATADIERGNVFVIAPTGERIPLATQRELAAAYGSLRASIRRADIVRDPMAYFPANRRACALRFLVEPGRAVAFDRVTVSDRRACFGRLFFRVPGGVQPGRWVLAIELEESSVRVPFDLAQPAAGGRG